jgi:hypothetical protein
MAEEVVIDTSAAMTDLSTWIARLPDSITKELRPYAAQLQAILYSKQPFLTGRLAGSAEILPPTVDTFFSLSLGREVVYAGWIEFGGTRGREYVPDGRTLWPTIVETESQFEHYVERATNDSIVNFHWNEPG